jgi:energy-coupling factor transporter ATP-binding protein EcfA2
MATKLVDKKNKKEIDIGKFKPEEHDLYKKVIAVIGPRGSGKSTLIKDLLYQVRKIPIGKVINGTERASPFYSDFVPDILIDTEWDLEKAEDFKDRAEDLMELKLNNPKYKRVNTHSFFLLDDCLYDDNWPKTKVMREIFMNGRHYNITFIVAMQTPLGLPPPLRDQIDYTFICGVSGNNNKQKIFDNYIKGIDNRKQFFKIVDSCTAGFNCLVIKNCAKATSMTDNVFWHKANEHSGFMMCNKVVWEFHGNKFNRNYKEKIRKRRVKEKEETKRIREAKRAAKRPREVIEVNRAN